MVGTTKIAHNLSAMNAERQLNITTGSLASNTEKLSSGYRINRAADDAAGLSISEKMRKQIRGLSQAVENAEDGISMVQIADGALGEVHDMLQRMNELCVQAANGTNSDTDRGYIQDEVTQLINEIDHVSETTKFNELYLLDGSLAKAGDKEKALAELDDILASYQKEHEDDSIMLTGLAGKYAGQSVSLDEIDDEDKVNVIMLTTTYEVVTTQTGKPDSDTSYSGTDANLASTLQSSIVPQAVNSILSAYSPAFDYLKGSSIGIGLEIYSANTNTLASVSVGYGVYDDQTVQSNLLTFQLSVNTNTLEFDSSGQLTDESRNELEVTIVHEMIHAFMDEATTNGMIGITDGTLDKTEEFPDWFAEGMAQTAAGGYYDGNDWINGSFGFTSSTSTDKITEVLTTYALSGSSNRSKYGTGYLACMYLGYLAGGSVMDASHLKSGLAKILSDIIQGKSLEEVVTSLTGKTSLSDFEADFATDGAEFVKELTAFVGSGTGGAVGDFTTNDDILSDSNPTDNLNLFALDTTHDTVYNIYPNDYTVLAGGTKTSGSDDTVPGAGTSSGTGDSGGTSGTGGTGDSGGTGGTGGTSGTGGSGTGVRIAAGEDSGGVELQVGADSDRSNRIRIYIDAMDAESIGVKDVDVTTEENATMSIERVAFAIHQVSTQRSELGAYQNRLEHTIKNLDNVVENTTAAESTLRDTDMEEEMVEYSQNSILQQAGQSMLAQTNQSQNGVLSLLT